MIRIRMRWRSCCYWPGEMADAFPMPAVDNPWMMGVVGDNDFGSHVVDLQPYQMTLNDLGQPT